MLYDMRWDAKVEADPLSLDSLIEWLEKQPAKATYDWDNCEGGCLYGQYVAAHGISWEASGACSTRVSGPKRAAFCALVYGNIAVCKPRTFGAALERARKLRDWRM